MGAHVIVTEVDPMRALEAMMDGLEVLAMERAAEVGDVFITATGDKHVIARRHLERMKDGAVLANTGHFNVEIELPALRQLAVASREARPIGGGVHPCDGRRLYLLAEGRLVNLVRRRGPSGRGDGHELRQPGAVGRVRSRARRLSSSAGSTACRARSTARSPG